jgi:hypothetical protein
MRVAITAAITVFTISPPLWLNGSEEFEMTWAFSFILASFRTSLPPGPVPTPRWLIEDANDQKAENPSPTWSIATTRWTHPRGERNDATKIKVAKKASQRLSAETADAPPIGDEGA